MPAAFSVDQRSAFTLPVEFHKPGAVEPITIRFSCAHLKLSELGKLEQEMQAAIFAYEGEDLSRFRCEAQAKFVSSIASAWDAASDFTGEQLSELFDSYPGAYPAFARAYSEELMGTREKS